jgi:hypothetical protein
MKLTVALESRTVLAHHLGVDESVFDGEAYEDGEFQDFDKLEEAGQQGCAFYGYAGAGCDYGPTKFAAAHGNYAIIDVNHNGDVVVPVEPCNYMGKSNNLGVRVKDYDSERAVRYYDLHEQAQFLVEEGTYDG